MNIHSLRVALVWNGTVFQEKTFGQMSEPVVTVGDDDKNMFIVLAGGLPETFQMFERTNDGYTLRLTDKLDTQITVDGEAHDLEELIEEHKATKSDSVTTDEGAATVYEVALKPGDWGIVSLGDVNIFFQLMDKMPVAPMRGLVSGVESILLGALILSTIAHVG
ncbi:MAG: hypothetical protein AAGI01_19060, partial [Myxococcota bacterium]